MRANLLGKSIRNYFRKKNWELRLKSAKHFIVDVWQCSEYAMVLNIRKFRFPKIRKPFLEKKWETFSGLAFLGKNIRNLFREKLWGLRQNSALGNPICYYWGAIINDRFTCLGTAVKYSWSWSRWVNAVIFFLIDTFLT